VWVYDVTKTYAGLDGLRGVAILLVIPTHVGGGWPAALAMFENTDGLAATFRLPLWLSGVSDSAGHGVQLFFAISAFTLTVRAKRDRDSGLRSYAFRRLARVGPGYWLAGVGYTLLAGLAPREWAPHGVGAADLAIAAGFGSAWQGGASLAVVPGGWSVACEVSFYVALPFLVRIIDWRISRALLLLGASVLVAWLRHVQAAEPRGFAVYVNPLVQAPVFLCGVTAAVIAMRSRLPRVPGAAMVLLGTGIFGIPFSPIGTRPHLQFALLAAIVVALAAVNPPRVLASRLMCKVGEVSYSMYLVHFAVLAPSLSLAEWLVPADDWLTMVVHLVVTSTASFALSCLTFATIERPAIRWAAERTRRSPVSVPTTAVSS
jgi:peptidoglycan/LPS O-acetylase OafA/YrhL